MSVTERVPAGEITERARQARPGAVLLTLVLGFFFVLGWLPGRLTCGLADCAVAVRLGYQGGRGLPPAEQASPGAQ